ncbi:MAG TPA: hypothetical protein PLY87_05350 [Planctomycetaceae bacterium]|nr:hypothetical protein [Planctomycetaceae bacterium]
MIQTHAHASSGNSTKISANAVRLDLGLSGQRPMVRRVANPVGGATGVQYTRRSADGTT